MKLGLQDHAVIMPVEKNVSNLITDVKWFTNVWHFTKLQNSTQCGSAFVSK
jgi:hypothetical protein